MTKFCRAFWKQVTSISTICENTKRRERDVNWCAFLKLSYIHWVPHVVLPPCPHCGKWKMHGAQLPWPRIQDLRSTKTVRAGLTTCPVAQAQRQFNYYKGQSWELEPTRWSPNKHDCDWGSHPFLPPVDGQKPEGEMKMCPVYCNSWLWVQLSNPDTTWGSVLGTRGWVRNDSPPLITYISVFFSIPETST